MANRQIAGLTARTLALSDVIATQVANGATEAGKNTIQDVADLIGGGLLKVVKVSFSAAEILNLFTTPKNLVAAQGAGTVIMPIRIIINKTYVSTTYTTNLNLVMGTGTVFASTFSNALGFSASEIAGYTVVSNGSVSPATSSINAPITLAAATGNPVAGDGTMDVYLYYVVITL